MQAASASRSAASLPARRRKSFPAANAFPISALARPIAAHPPATPSACIFSE